MNEEIEMQCFKDVANYIKDNDISEVHFYIDENGEVHCDIVIKTIYQFNN